MTEMRSLNDEELSDFNSMFKPMGGTVINHGDMTELQLYVITYHEVISSFRSVVEGELRIIQNIHTQFNDSVARAENVRVARDVFSRYGND